MTTQFRRYAQALLSTTIIVSIALTAPAFAAGTVTNTGTAATGVDLDGLPNDALVNSGDITGTTGTGNAAVYANADVVSIENKKGGTITGDGDGAGIVLSGKSLGTLINDGDISGGSGNAAGIYVDVNVQSVTNNGTITGSGNSTGFAIDGTLGTLLNSGTISGGPGGNGLYVGDEVTSITNTSGGTISGQGAVYLSTGVGTFINNGTIDGTTDSGVYVDGNVQSIINNSTIIGAAGVNVDGTVISLVNNGTIDGTTGTGVFINEAVQSFINNHIIKSTDDQAILINGDVTKFINTGTITGSTSNEAGVRFDGLVGSFLNTNKITGYENGVWFKGGLDVFENTGDIFSNTEAAIRANLSSPTISSFKNSGNIISTNDDGLQISAPVTMFVNSGTISGGVRGAVLNSVANFTNTGTIKTNDINNLAVNI